MSKLTKYTRERIAAQAVAFAFDPKEEALKAQEDALAREAHAAVFKKAELDAIKKVPANWIRLDPCLRFNVGGQRLYLRTIDDGLPVPYKIGDYAGYSCREIGAIEPGDLCDRIQTHAQAVEKCKTELRQAYIKVIALLDSVTTIKRLREVWPEGEPFYSKYEAQPAQKLPAVPASEVNAMLGIAA